MFYGETLVLLLLRYLPNFKHAARKQWRLMLKKGAPSKKHLHHHVSARSSMFFWTAPFQCLVTAKITTWMKQRKASQKHGTTCKLLTTPHVYMMGPSSALYGHSKCDVSEERGRNQLRWPQLDFTPDLTRHRFVCSAIIFFNIRFTQQLP